MTQFLCKTCGLQHPESAAPPERCLICEDDRQYVPKAGQEWVTSDEVAVNRFNAFKQIAPGLIAIHSVPQFAIGQRAILVLSPDGNVLWDCISYLDSATIEIINAFGGLKAIAVSHPHFYSSMAKWGRAFDCPVYVHDADRQWITEPDAHVQGWSGESMQILPHVQLHRFGGHFPGNTVLHLPQRRALLAGDTVLVTWDRKHVAFMWSYPNYVPLSAAEVTRLGERFEALEFDALHSAFWGRGDIFSDAKSAIRRSVQRHIEGRGEEPAAVAS